jgi:RNA polymerase sigma factor (sigma-70 family)
MLDQQEQLFNQVLRENRASIYRICRAYLYDQSMADDLYQEILFQIWKSMKTFKGQSRVSTWVYRIAVNTSIGFNRKNKATHTELLPESLQLPYEESLLKKQEEEEQIDHLRFCIGKLPEAERLIISLVLEDKSYKEIAEITGANVSNVGVKINRIKARLLKLMSISQHHEL